MIIIIKKNYPTLRIRLNDFQVSNTCSNPKSIKKSITTLPTLFLETIIKNEAHRAVENHFYNSTYKLVMTVHI